MAQLLTRRRILSVCLVGAKIFGLAAAVVGVYLAVVLSDGNFHVVVPGELYRSAQPTPDEIADYAESYGIKTIINLRGTDTNAVWYRAEIAESDKLGIAHIDFRMSPKRELTEPQAAALIALLKHAKKPILVHCANGADRTSLASALYLAAVDHDGEEAAENQISLWYGHFALPLMPNFAMDDSWENLEPWLGFPNS
jgi:protein tyrosine/serine phosphatase